MDALGAPAMYLRACEKLGVERLEYARYQYTPQQITDKRVRRSVGIEAAQEVFVKLQRTLPKGTDLAIHSRVWRAKDKDPHHIIMLDLACEITDEVAKSLEDLCMRFECRQMAIFSSGRSGHLYGYKVLNEREWVEFMGSALLLNLPGKPPVSDTRWIGHRLVAGYGSLRWTKNSDWYLSEPVYASAVELSRDAVRQRWLF